MKKIFKKYLQKGVARNKKGSIFASAIEENLGCEVLWKQWANKSSLKGKEPFNSKRL